MAPHKRKLVITLVFTLERAPPISFKSSSVNDEPIYNKACDFFCLSDFLSQLVLCD